MQKKAANGELFAVVIDDDPYDLELLSVSLRECEEFGEVHALQTGEGLVDYLRDLVIMPDVIVTDINMPLVSGFDILSDIKADSTFSNIPVIICSSSDWHTDLEKAKKLGAKAFITKAITYNGSNLTGKVVAGVLTGQVSAFHTKMTYPHQKPAK